MEWVSVYMFYFAFEDWLRLLDLFSVGRRACTELVNKFACIIFSENSTYKRGVLRYLQVRLVILFYDVNDM